MRQCNTLVVSVTAMLMLPVSFAWAQPSAPAASPQTADLLHAAEMKLEPKKEEERSKKRQAQRDPLVRSGLTLPEPQLTFETVKGKGRATGTIGFVRQQAQGETSFVLAMSAPIGDSADAEARPVDLRGLSDGANVTVGFNGASMFRAFSVSDITKLCAGIAKEECTAGKLEEENSALSQQLLSAVFRKVPVLYAATFTYGRNKFTFFDGGGAKQDRVRHNDVQLEGTLGFLVNRRTNLLAFHLAYSDTYKASSDKTQLCRSLPDAGGTRCDSAVIGKPSEERSAIGTIEYRWQLAGEPKVPVAFAPKFQLSLGLDGASDVTSFEFPVYFFQEKADRQASSTAPKLNGGVSAGWRSDIGFQAYVFIGTTFKLLKI